MQGIVFALGTILIGSSFNLADREVMQEYQIVDDTIPTVLSEVPTDAERGKEVFESRSLGHCVLCHKVSSLEAPFMGDIGPDLSTIGDVLSPGQLRLRIVDASVLNPETIMPPYYRIENLNQVASEYGGKPVLTAQDVEDLVAWMSGLKE